MGFVRELVSKKKLVRLSFSLIIEARKGGRTDLVERESEEGRGHSEHILKEFRWNFVVTLVRMIRERHVKRVSKPYQLKESCSRRCLSYILRKLGFADRGVEVCEGKKRKHFCVREKG